MSELQAKQVTFVHYLACLFDKFYGINLTLGEAWRSPETCALYAKEGKGVIHSCHENRLAVDLNIILSDGTCSNNKADYQPLGDYWKSLPVLYPSSSPVVTAWGGDFTSLCDMYHFSIEWQGVR